MGSLLAITAEGFTPKLEGNLPTAFLPAGILGSDPGAFSAHSVPASEYSDAT